MIRHLPLLFAAFLSLPVHATQPVQERILILGDSLTEGYGVAQSEAYPAQLDALLKKEGYTQVEIKSAGVSGATSASGLARLKWALKGTSKPTALILELGANDGLRGRKVAETKKDLKEILALAKQNGLTLMLAGMKMPMNYSESYRTEFEAMYVDLAKEMGAHLLPFLLEGVGGDPKLNLADGIHPNPEGHKKVASVVLPHVVKFLKLEKKSNTLK